MTEMERAFRETGILPEDAEFDVAIAKAVAKYQDSGGTVERAKARLRLAADRMPDGDQYRPVASRGDQKFPSPIRQPIPVTLVPASEPEINKGVEAMPSVSQDHMPFSSAPLPQASGSGQSRFVQKDYVSSSAAARPPVQKPSGPSRSLIAGIGAAKLASAKTILDMRKTADGRAWGDIGAHELSGMARDGSLAKAILDRLGSLTHAQRFKPLRDLITPAAFQDALMQVECPNV